MHDADNNRTAAIRRDPGHHAMDSVARLVLVKALRCASTPPQAGLAALTTDAVEPTEGKDVMPRETARLRRQRTQFRRSVPMINTTTTPSIEVTIGHQTRQYHAFVTTAPAACDAPSTLTLYAGPLTDVVGFAVDPVVLDDERARTPSRLILIDTTELAWQRARCRTRAHRLAPADPVLVGPNTLQQWLWQRLQVPPDAHA
ncbi:MAG: hypothetical protein ABIX28_01960 [Vicinamibacterales bacterium]